MLSLGCVLHPSNKQTICIGHLGLDDDRNLRNIFDFVGRILHVNSYSNLGVGLVRHVFRLSDRNQLHCKITLTRHFPLRRKFSDQPIVDRFVETHCDSSRIAKRLSEWKHTHTTPPAATRVPAKRKKAPIGCPIDRRITPFSKRHLGCQITLRSSTSRTSQIVCDIGQPLNSTSLALPQKGYRCPSQREFSIYLARLQEKISRLGRKRY